MIQERVNVIKTVKDIHKFNNELKTIQDRSDYVNDILESNIEVIEKHNKIGDNKILKKQKMLEKNLEKLGTYLLRSSDIDGSRSLEDYPFYRDNYELYGQTVKDSNNDKIQRVIPTDPQDNSFVFDDYNGIGKNTHVNKWRLFDFSSMEQEHKMYFIKNCLISKSDIGNEFQGEYQESYEYIMSLAKDDKDIMIINLTIEGQTQKDIAVQIGISQPAVTQRLSRIIKNM